MKNFKTDILIIGGRLVGVVAAITARAAGTGRKRDSPKNFIGRPKISVLKNFPYLNSK